MALNIDSIEGGRVYVSGYIDLEQPNDNTLIATGFDIGENETIVHDIDQVMLHNLPGSGYGRYANVLGEKSP